jgi:hypothetical protein
MVWFESFATLRLPMYLFSKMSLGWLLIGGAIVNVAYSVLLYSVPGLHWIQYTVLAGSFTTLVMAALMYSEEEIKNN